MDHEVEIVDGGEGKGSELLGFEEVVEVGEGEFLAGRTGAIEGREVVAVFELFDLEAAGVGEKKAVAGSSGRVGAVEGIDTVGNEGRERRKVADAEEMVGFVIRQKGAGKGDNLFKFFLVFADAAANREAVEGELG